MKLQQKDYSKNMTVVIIDSGISSLHDFKNNVIGGITIKEIDGQCFVENTFEDEIGHGTAVADILLKTAPETKIFSIKIFDDEILTSLNKLCFALEYIYENIECNFVQIRGGVTVLDDYERLKSIIDKLYNKKVYVISAFDNDGAVSYPAAFDNVIGIDISTDYCKQEEFELVEGSIIDIRGADTFFRAKWVEPLNIIIRGSSFVTSYITGLIINNLSGLQQYSSKAEILTALKVHARNIIKSQNFYNPFNGSQFVKEIKKAIVFPFNKEVHSIAAFSDLLSFTIEDFYDVKYSRVVNKKVKDIVKYCESDKVIKNYINIDWDSDFDTIICGHCDTLSKTLGYDLLGQLIELCIKHNKRMYAFDNIMNYIKAIDKDKIQNFYFPYVDLTLVPQNRFGKIRYTSKPVLGILGTSSQQGKHTLQLYLRKIFKERGYNVGQLGTEPSGYLFGFDRVYPMGYNSSVYINTLDAVNVLNEMIWCTELNNPDIIIAGSQSGTIPYDFGNLSRYTFSQYDFLLGTLPDAFILCVNPNDDPGYIRRTIQFIESISESKIIGIALYPIKTTAGKLGLNMTRKKLDDIELKELTEKLSKAFSVPVYNLNIDSINELADGVIKFFSGA